MLSVTRSAYLDNMGIFDRLFKKKSNDGVLIPLNAHNMTYEQLIESLGGNRQDAEYSANDGIINGYSRNPLINQVINKIAQTCAGLPLTYGNSQEEALIKKPNQQDFKSEYFEKIVISLLSTGNAFLFSEDYISGLPKESYVLRTQDLDPNFGEFNIPFNYDYDAGNGYFKTILPNELVHIKLPNVIDNGQDSFWGVSPIRALKRVYDTSNDIFEAQAHIFKNKGATGIVSSSDSMMPLTPNQQEELDRTYKNRLGGVSNYNAIKTVAAPIQYTKIGENPKDLLMGETTKDFLRIICSSFGVDSALFNDPDNKTYSNREEAKKDYYNDVIMPLMNKILEAINYSYGMNLQVDTDGIETLNPNEDENGIQPEE